MPAAFAPPVPLGLALRRRLAPAASTLLALAALLVLLAVAAVADFPAPGRVILEPSKQALARLDSLQAIVWTEEKRVQSAPRVEAHWDRLARAWFQVGDHAKAAQCLERARALGAREFDTMLLCGRVARSEGRFSEAVEWLERAARARPGEWEAHEDLGLALYLGGHYTQAADHWERARALPGSAAPDRSGLIAALRKVGEGPYRVSGRGRERLSFVPDKVRGALVVPVRVNGRGPYSFRIDAGSPEVVLGRSLAQELAIAASAGKQSPLAAAVGLSLHYGVLDSLTLGATTLHRLPVAVSPHPGLDDTEGVRGLLGFEALRRFRFCLDFPDSALWLEPLSPAAASPDSARPAWAPAGRRAHRVPVFLRGTHLLLAYGRVSRGPERPFLLDTGSPGIALAAPASTIAEAGATIDTTHVLRGSSAAGSVHYLRFPVERLCVGGTCRDSLAGVYGTFPSRLELNPNFRLAGIVSRGFLSRYRFGVDLARGEVWLVEP